jgi:hypothetical protein
MIRAVGDRVIRKEELQDHYLSTPDWIVRDVLFVNGVETIPHPYRYRVLHQMEQLRAAGYTVGEKKASELEPEDVLNGNVINELNVTKAVMEVEAPSVIKGDVNGDGQVGIGDIISVTNYMASGTESGFTLEQADVNGDGQVGIGDIISISNIMAGNSNP